MPRKYEITHQHFSNDLIMWIKQCHTEMFFVYKTKSVFSDFVDIYVTGKCDHTWGAHVCKAGELAGLS